MVYVDGPASACIAGVLQGLPERTHTVHEGRRGHPGTPLGSFGRTSASREQGVAPFTSCHRRSYLPTTRCDMQARQRTLVPHQERVCERGVFGSGRGVYPLSQAPPFYDGENPPLVAVAWPPQLKSIYFGTFFISLLDRTGFPASVQGINFGAFFREPVDRVNWPPFLTTLTFGKFFNRPVHCVRWPASLKYLTFGGNFDQPANHVS